MSSDGPSQTTQQTQQSQTQPWAPAVPLLSSLLDSYSGQNTGVTPGQTAATNTLTGEAGAIPNLGGAGSTALNNLFGSSTAPQMGMLKDAYSSLQGNLNPTASGANLDPYSTPGFADAMRTMTSDATNAVKGVYAGSGRSPSGAGSFGQSLARGITQGEAPTIAGQYNTNMGNMLGANSTLFGAGSNAATTGAGLGQIPLTNSLTALQNIGMLGNAFTMPGQTQLGAANTAYGLPYQNLQSLLGPALGIASLGSSSTGSGTSTTQSSGSGLSNILGGVSGGLGILGSLFSDERLKENIEKVGELDDGSNVYRYNFRGVPETTHIGMLAHEVRRKTPQAVHEIGGMLAVNYRTATNRAAEMRKAA